MQKVSGTYKRLQTSQRKEYQTRLIIDGAGTYGEDKLISVKTDIRLFSGSPTVGGAVAGEITVVMINPSVTIPRMARMRLYIRATGIADKSGAVTITDEKISSTYFTRSSEKITVAAGANATVGGETITFPVTTTESLTSEWIQQGVYFIDTRKVTANANGLDVLTLHGYDAMLKAEQDFSNQTLPDDVDISFVERIASTIGVQIDVRTYAIITSGYTIPMNIAYTLREYLSYIASMYAGVFIITEVGKLRLVTFSELPKETNLLIDTVGDVLIFGQDAILI